MFGNENNRVRHITGNRNHGNQLGSKFIWNPQKKSIQAVNPNDPDRGNMEITPLDLGHF